MRVGCAAILHNGVIIQKVNECYYNSALCNLALGRLVFYEKNKNSLLFLVVKAFPVLQAKMCNYLKIIKRLNDVPAGSELDKKHFYSPLFTIVFTVIYNQILFVYFFNLTALNFYAAFFL